MGIVEDLVAAPGLYIGIDHALARGTEGAARMVVTALPGGASVSLDYEVLNPEFPDDVRGHVEHTVIGRTHGVAGAVMVISDTHAGALTILRESDKEPGVFDTSDVPLPYPMMVVVSVPEPGQIRHAWWYGRPGDDPIERDISELRRVE
jgi:hypothetical protein